MISIFFSATRESLEEPYKDRGVAQRGKTFYFREGFSPEPGTEEMLTLSSPKHDTDTDKHHLPCILNGDAFRWTKDPGDE